MINSELRPTVDVALLGPLRVQVDGTEIRLRSDVQRRLLAALALSAGAAVPAEHLFGLVWPDVELSDPRAALHTAMRRLRRNLGDAGASIVTEAHGYRFAIDPLACDVHRFRHLVRTADNAPDPAGVIREALLLWRADPGNDGLPDLPGPSAAALIEERIDALGRKIDLDLAAGRQQSVIAELSGLTASWPLHERFWSQLMTALCGCGRQGDALAAYEQVRRRLDDELGVEPGPELRRAHMAALTGELAPADGQSAEAAAPGSADASSTWTTQHQLPLDVTELVGRDTDVDAVRTLLLGQGCPVVVVTGLPGVGKSALAVHVAHQVQEHFPDGQLYLSLGAGRRRPPSPEQLLDMILRATGADMRRSPPERDARAAAMRSRLAGRRVLLVLDDAADADQVSALLPGTDGCAVLVTSRNRLPELTALYDASSVPVAALSADNALEVVKTALGPRRFDPADPRLHRVVELCGRLPLALRIASANFAHDPELSPHEYCERLQDHGVDELAIPGSTIGIADTFDSWLDALDPSIRRAFSLCAASPTIDLSQDAAAALLDLPAARTARVLQALCAANLLTRTGRQRYVIHDLLRDHAAGRRERDASGAHAPAIDRLAQWYLDRMDETVAAIGDVTFGQPRRATSVAAHFADAHQAMAWAEAELQNIVGIVVQCAQSTSPHFSWALTSAARPLLNRGTHLPEWGLLLEAALPAAERSEDEHASAAMHNSAGSYAAQHGDLERARWHYRKAVRQYEQHSYDAGAAVVLNNLAQIESEIGSLPDARDYYDRAVEVAAGSGEDRLTAAVLANRSDVRVVLGDPRGAIADADGALRLSPLGVGVVGRTNRGSALAACGRYAEAHEDTAAAMDAWVKSAMGSVTGPVGPAIEFAQRCLDIGDTASAERLAHSALDASRSAEDDFRTVDALLATATVSRVCGDVDRAVALVLEALDVTARIGGHRAVRARTCLAQALLAAGRVEQAGEQARTAEHEARQASMPVEQCLALLVSAAVARSTGDAVADELEARIAKITATAGFVPRPSDRVGTPALSGSRAASAADRTASR